LEYISTRGGMPPQPFTAILLEGLAPDGGLTVPATYPKLRGPELAQLRPLGYRRLAFALLSMFADDIPPAELEALIDRTYTAATFGSDEITPLLTLEPGVLLLRASNGPTLAFKDIAMQLLGNLFEHALAEGEGDLNIVGATSGDTGSSAEYAMRGKRGIRVFMLSPKDRMSPFQTAQMYSLTDPNIFNIAIDGVFDDCQDIVKAIGADAAFKRDMRIGTVNSINWARVAAQIVYYFKAYFAATRKDTELVSFAVPSGNFGNILAGHVARQMGLPIRRLILATNENDVLDEFIRTARYRVRRAEETLQTSSPSMDISRASNFERFVFDLADGDAAKVRELWAQLERDGGFDLSGTPLEARLRESGFVSGRSTHADRIATIQAVADNYRMVVDPHTADGIKVGLENRENGIPVICIETALPAKFASTIREALGRQAARPAAYVGIEERPQRYAVLPPDVAAVKSYIAERATR
jgi:threonine synthase